MELPFLPISFYCVLCSIIVLETAAALCVFRDVSLSRDICYICLSLIYKLFFNLVLGTFNLNNLPIYPGSLLKV